MANASQIVSLIHSHFASEDERFSTLALQIAAHEARLGHTSTAQQIREIIEKEKSSKAKLKVIKIHSDLGDLIYETTPKNRLNQLVLPDELKLRIERILKEYRQRGKLQKHGLSHRRKILLVGPPGTGKSMTAATIAGELHLPLYSVQMDKIVTKYLGETSAKLRQIFDFIEAQKGVFLFDEFDAIGTERSKENEVGEMRRVLNSLLQFMEASNSESLIIAATNNISLLDKALFRRFEDILYYQLPSPQEAILLIKNRLGSFGKGLKLNGLEKEVSGLSHAQLTQASDDAIKESILNDMDSVDYEILINCLREKKHINH
ncbi:MAG: ATP-binding protein [Lewinellaceae bacterium]|nr:ATP-binding protein [Saprospiraceae bacterium]MCB9340472.1 ATP-binding protein [Lewinellaceae bacterium]